MLSNAEFLSGLTGLPVLSKLPLRLLSVILERFTSADNAIFVKIITLI